MVLDLNLGSLLRLLTNFKVYEPGKLYTADPDSCTALIHLNKFSLFYSGINTTVCKKRDMPDGSIEVYFRGTEEDIAKALLTVSDNFY